LPGLDALAIGAHADDVELGCGGTLALLAEKGYRTGILDITDAALSTRGDIATRAAEAALAAEILKAERWNLGARESAIYPDAGNLEHLVQLLRATRPTLLIVHYETDRHPDHSAVSRLTREAVFWAGVIKFSPGLEPHRPRRVFHYFAHIEGPVSLIVDVSRHHAQKMAAVCAYRSQFFTASGEAPDTFISRPEFMDRVETRARHYGDMIGVRYGEAFHVREAIRIENPIEWTLRQGDLG